MESCLIGINTTSSYISIYFGMTLRINSCLTKLTISAPITPRLMIVGMNTDAPMIQHTMNAIFCKIY